MGHGSKRDVGVNNWTNVNNGTRVKRDTGKKRDTESLVVMDKMFFFLISQSVFILL